MKFTRNVWSHEHTRLTFTLLAPHVHFMFGSSIGKYTTPSCFEDSKHSWINAVFFWSTIATLTFENTNAYTKFSLFGQSNGIHDCSNDQSCVNTQFTLELIHCLSITHLQHAILKGKMKPCHTHWFQFSTASVGNRWAFLTQRWKLYLEMCSSTEYHKVSAKSLQLPDTGSASPYEEILVSSSVKTSPTGSY